MARYIINYIGLKASRSITARLRRIRSALSFDLHRGRQLRLELVCEPNSFHYFLKLPVCWLLPHTLSPAPSQKCLPSVFSVSSRRIPTTCF
jgi:hypothetical protein